MKEWRRKNAAHVKAHLKAYKEKHKERIKTQRKVNGAAAYQRNKVAIVARHAAWCKEHPGHHRKIHLRKYQLTVEMFDAMAQAQGGNCAICRRPCVLCVDHNHATNKVRALLCHNCNSGLGLFQDSPDICAAAVAYLKQHS